MHSPLIFHRQCWSGETGPALGHATIMASSRGLGWQGFQLEEARAIGVSMEDLTVDGHFIAINLSDAPLRQETRYELNWKPSCMPPKSFWINPEGRPFSIRHRNPQHVAICLIDGKFLDAVMGRHFELRGGIGIVDETLAHLMQSLIVNIHDKEHYSLEIATQLINTFVYVLATRHGHPADELPVKGGIAPTQLKSLLTWIEAHVGDPLTVDLMAARAGISAAHFAREFKRSTGRTPWEYFVQLRLDNARNLLEAGESVTTAAMRSGFSDQPHLSRLFKQRFGVSPSGLVKAIKGSSEKPADLTSQGVKALWHGAQLARISHR